MDKKTQSNYTICLANNQLSLPLEIFTSIPEDDPVNLLNAILEKVDYSIFDAAYSRLGRIEYSPRILTKVLVYGYMRKCYSSRDMALACRENIKFRYLLEGQNPPSHNTINRFRSQYLPPVHEQLFQQICRLFHQAGYLSLEQVFIDGTKIEGNANKYSFVWKKSSEKRLKKLQTRIYEELPVLLQETGIHFRVPEKVQIRHLKKILKKLAVRREKEQIEFVYGKGKRKTSLQRTTEKVTEWLDKMKRYTQDLHICGNRNSYSKTDHDATFMHMKEDYMRNGQLKPGYNVNVATANGFIVGNYISSERSDVGTLIPFMDKLGLTSTSKIVVDSGYESEENYCYFEQSGKPDLYVKPSNPRAEERKEIPDRYQSKRKHALRRKSRYLYLRCWKGTYPDRHKNGTYQDRIPNRKVHLLLPGLQRLSSQGTMYSVQIQSSSRGTKQDDLCFQALCPTEKSHGRKNQYGRRKASPCEPYDPGRRHFCRNKTGHGFPPISSARTSKSRSRMDTVESG